MQQSMQLHPSHKIDGRECREMKKKTLPGEIDICRRITTGSTDTTDGNLEQPVRKVPRFLLEPTQLCGTQPCRNRHGMLHSSNALGQRTHRDNLPTRRADEAAVAIMPLRRLRCPHFLLALDGRLLLPSLSTEEPGGDSGCDWRSMSVKRLEGMLRCEYGWIALPLSHYPKRSVTRLLVL